MRRNSEESQTNTRLFAGGSPQRLCGEPAQSDSASDDPIEGDTITVDATIHNAGSLDTGPLTASFFATPPARWGEWYIGSAFVPNVPGGGHGRPRHLRGTPWASPATCRCASSVDPYNRLAETNETNNQATANLTIKTRPDLRVTAITLSDAEPVVGEAVNVATLTLRNDGQTQAAAPTPWPCTTATPTPAERSWGRVSQPPSPAAPTTTVAFTWTPAAPGLHRLFASGDRDRRRQRVRRGQQRDLAGRVRRLRRRRS